MRNLEPQSTMALVAALDPATVNSTPKYSDVVDTTLHPMLLAVFSLGDMAAEAIFLVIERCDSDGSNAATLKSISLSSSAGGNDNTQHMIFVESADLVGQTQKHVRAKMVTDNTTGGPGSAIILSTASRYQPATAYNVASLITRLT